MTASSEEEEESTFIKLEKEKSSKVKQKAQVVYACQRERRPGVIRETEVESGKRVRSRSGVGKRAEKREKREKRGVRVRVKVQ